VNTPLVGQSKSPWHEITPEEYDGYEKTYKIRLNRNNFFDSLIFAKDFGIVEFFNNSKSNWYKLKK
jgi:hypothetical protein